MPTPPDRAAMYAAASRAYRARRRRGLVLVTARIEVRAENVEAAEAAIKQIEERYGLLPEQ